MTATVSITAAEVARTVLELVTIAKHWTLFLSQGNINNPITIRAEMIAPRQRNAHLLGALDNRLRAVIYARRQITSAVMIIGRADA